jgi:hypothetical protein
VGRVCPPHGERDVPLNEIVRLRMNDEQWSADHLRELAAILETLRPHRVMLYEHHYNLQAFGSFEVVIGRPHRRLRFLWDGREFLLGAQESNFVGAVDPPQWRELVSTQLESSKVFGEICEITSQAFAI